ncbi:PAAR domain-containing protein [Aquitalea sp. LB_tupeE]|uniref:PAAR domain-containing protein n=1 Tax=Aquitalea sp. LB_tupeE TaxID=2748078 RepID=UPI0015BB8B60|nr:PAAR domain-containing protein [Aquitalea sp. LB_tupeE]NWK78082.1 PAAR domain-containing protein [Aquitalea sp. LB_tupeE]
MPQIRYVCLQGDPITGGGQVREGIGHDKAYIDGKEPTADGLKGWCNVCKSMGVIRCVGPRPSHAPDNIHGYKLALNGDYLICQCPKPQKLMNTSTAWEVIIDDAYIVGWNKANTGAAVASTIDDGLKKYNDFYQLCDEDGMPMINAEYSIKRANGIHERGITDSGGYTHMIEDHKDAEIVAIHIGDFDG